MPNDNEIPMDKLLPWDRDIERSVLGTLMRGDDPELTTRFVGFLNTGDFHLEAHKRIWRCVEELSKAGTHVDRITVAKALQEAGTLQSIGAGSVFGISYLVDLDDGMGSIFGIDEYAKRLRDKAIARRAIELMDKCTRELQLYGDHADTLVSVQEQLRDLQGYAVGDTHSIKTPLQILEEGGGINAYFNREGAAVTMPFSELNFMLSGGLRSGDYCVIAARPSDGKSALASQIALYAAQKGIGTVIFTTEMDNQSQLDRLIAFVGEVPLSSIRMDRMSPEERKRASGALNTITNLPIRFDDTGANNMTAIRVSLRKWMQTESVGLIVIDYLQLLQSLGKHENRNQEITAISRSIKLLAKELKIPIVVLSQINRGDGNEDTRPQLRRLRESGAIEQDADIVMFLHDASGNRDAAVRSIELRIAKQRNGPLGHLNLFYIGKYTKFGVAEDQEEGG